MVGENRLTQPYDGYIDKVVEVVDPANRQKIVSFVYFCSIGGRERPDLFEWSRCTQEGLDIGSSYAVIADRLQRYRDGRAVFAISFPPITKFLGWETKKKESNLQLVEFFNTESMKPIPRNETEVGCALELLLFGKETELWLNTASLDEYLSVPRTDAVRALMRNPNKVYEAEHAKK